MKPVQDTSETKVSGTVVQGEITDAMQTADALIQMNQAGYLDGYMKANGIRYTGAGRGATHRERKLWERIKGDWKIAFDQRFKKGVIKEIKALEDEKK